MDRESIKELLKEVLGPNTPLEDHPEWVGLHCPLAPWKHASGKDSSQSAGVSVKDGDVSIFNCFGCHTKGPITLLLKELEKFTGDNHAKLIRSLDGEEFIGGVLPEWGKLGMAQKEPKTLNTAEYLDLYETAYEHPYVVGRGIDKATAEKLQLRLDEEDSAGEERILFPVFRADGELYGFSGRATHKNAELRIRDYHGLPKAWCLLGEHLLERGDPYIVLVEGLFDYARMVMYDIPVVATMHSGVTKQQAHKLIAKGKPLVTMFDNDQAGYDATALVVKMFKGKLPVSTTSYLSRGNIRHSRAAAKDPDGLTYKEVLWMLKKAEIA